MNDPENPFGIGDFIPSMNVDETPIIIHSEVLIHNILNT
jgi:hypothetical protein